MTLSKTQTKRIQRDIDRIEFLIARRKNQKAMFDQAVAVGLKIYEDNKEKFSEEEIKQLEELRQENERLLEQIAGQITDLETELHEANQRIKA